MSDGMFRFSFFMSSSQALLKNKCTISFLPAKVVLRPDGLCKAGAPSGFAEKIILAVPAPVFFRKALHYPGAGQ